MNSAARAIVSRARLPRTGFVLRNLGCDIKELLLREGFEVECLHGREVV